MKGSSSDEKLLVALAHPLRRRLLRFIASQAGDVTPTACANEFGSPLPMVSYHVRVLADCGALTLITTKPVRGSLQHFYKLSPAVEDSDWVQENLRRLAEADSG